MKTSLILQKAIAIEALIISNFKEWCTDLKNWYLKKTEKKDVLPFPFFQGSTDFVFVKNSTTVSRPETTVDLRKLCLKSFHPILGRFVKKAGDDITPLERYILKIEEEKAGNSKLRKPNHELRKGYPDDRSATEYLLSMDDAYTLTFSEVSGLLKNHRELVSLSWFETTATGAVEKMEASTPQKLKKKTSKKQESITEHATWVTETSVVIPGPLFRRKVQTKDKSLYWIALSRNKGTDQLSVSFVKCSVNLHLWDYPFLVYPIPLIIEETDAPRMKVVKSEVEHTENKTMVA